MIGDVPSFRLAITSPNRIPVHEWCGKHVKLPYGSSRSPTYAPDLTPWVIEPLTEIFDNANREIVILAPVGSGKSAMIEALTNYIIAEDPGPTLITGQTDEDIGDWAESRLWGVLRATKPTADLFPTDRQKVRKTEILFAHMPVWLTGANMSGLQSKSIRWLIGDEAWMWKRGLIEEFRNRMHRRWNGRRILMGQAGVEGDDFTRAFEEGEHRDWCFTCPKCKHVQPFEMSQLKWPEGGTNSERARKCRYHCGHCKASFPDTTASRRRLCDSARYEVVRKAETPGHISFHYNVLTLWDSPWSDVAAGWLNAQDALKKGDSTPLMQFLQKQLAEPWKEEMSINRPNLDIYDGRVEEFANGEKIDGEHVRFATVDVQRDHYWVLIRAWRGDGSSVSLWYGRINAEETVAELVSRYQVRPEHVYLDTGYDTGRIYDVVVRYGWVGIRGDQAKSYRHNIGGRKVERPYSPIKYAVAPCGKRARYFFISTDNIKDILAKLRGGEGAEWQALEDMHQSYALQLDSEVREEFLTPKENQSSFRWVRKKRDNHAWDCEVYQTAAALVWKLFGD